MTLCLKEKNLDFDSKASVLCLLISWALGSASDRLASSLLAT